MNISIKMFAVARDLAGAEELVLELVEPATVATLVMALASSCSALEPILAASRVAVNQSFAGSEHPVGATDELALIPPVSGG